MVKIKIQEAIGCWVIFVINTKTELWKSNFVIFKIEIILTPNQLPP